MTPVSSDRVERERSAPAPHFTEPARLTVSDDDNCILSARRRGIRKGGIDRNEMIRRLGLIILEAGTREGSLKRLKVEVAVAKNGICRVGQNLARLCRGE